MKASSEAHTSLRSVAALKAQARAGVQVERHVRAQEGRGMPRAGPHLTRLARRVDIRQIVMEAYFGKRVIRGNSL